MGNILAQIKKQKPRGDNAALHSMVDDIRSRAESDALELAKSQIMSKVGKELDGLRNQLAATREELSQANATVKVAQGERDSMKSLLRAAEGASGPLEKRITQLIAQLKLEQQTAKTLHADMQGELKDVSGDLASTRAELAALQVENAKLVGKFEAQPATVKRRVVRKAPKADPEFILTDVTRDAFDKISGGKIKVVRA